MDRNEWMKWARIGLFLMLSFLITWLVRLDFPTITRPAGAIRVDAGVYATLGDICIYPAVLLVGNPWAALVSALGAGFADLAVAASRSGTSSSFYIIGSTLIKGGMAFFAGRYARKCNTWKKCFGIAGITEALMVIAYFLYDLLIVREFGVAGLDLLVNIIQAVVCGALGAVILHYLAPLVRRKKKGKKTLRTGEKETA